MRRPHLTLQLDLIAKHVRPQTPSSPVELLGPNHPLSRGAEFRRDLWRQSLVTVAVVLLGASGTASGRGWGLPLLAAAAIVQLALGVALALHAQLQRERARELIIAGRGGLPLQGVERERRRLQQGRRVEGLADALDDLVRAAEGWPTLLPTSRPVFDPRQVRATAIELHAIATRLRAGRVAVPAVARVERLLTSGASPLYGREREALRHELMRINAELDREHPTEPAPNPVARS